MKRVLSVQDLSCVGRCSLTVAMPVISAMGCQCAVLPTAVLSTHTAFPAPFVRSLTEDMASISEHWKRIGAEFDVISIGYLSDPAQAEAAAKLTEDFGGFVVLDPVMGDHGALYSRITGEHIRAMSALVQRAQLLLPNVTEAAALAGMEYRQTEDIGYYRALASRLLELGCGSAVITGATLAPEKTGFFGIDREGREFSYQTRRIPKSFHGTGDLFSAVITGGRATGLDTENAARLAASFVEKCISGTREVTPWGVEFERQLPWLWQKLQASPGCGCPWF